MLHERSDNPDTLRLFYDVRERIGRAVAAHFNEGLYPEFTHLTQRIPAADVYSEFDHGLHADACDFDFNAGYCTPAPYFCCHYRSHSAILYLADEGAAFQGGEFVFESKHGVPSDGATCSGVEGETRQTVPPKCGRLVAFTSGPENVHGVLRVREGTRYALAMWFTRDGFHAERAPEAKTFVFDGSAL